MTTTFAYSDATSGIASPCSAAAGATCTQQISSTGDGTGVTLSSGVATDLAGNTTSVSSGPFEIDSTPPGVTCASIARSFVFGQSGAMVSATVADGTSGPAQSLVSASVPTSSVATNLSLSLTGLDNADNSTAVVCPYSVTTAATSTQLAASLNPSMLGPPVTFTATVGVQSPGAGTITGSVTFLDGTTALGSAMVSTANGVTTATLGASSLGLGPHTISAVYGGSTT